MMGWTTVLLTYWNELRTVYETGVFRFCSGLILKMGLTR